MRLTVLGNASRYLAPFSAGTGYLVEQDRAVLLLDCGPGVRGAPELQNAASDVRAILVSHTHFDHALDLVPVLKELPRARLVLPPGGEDAMASLADAFQFRDEFRHAGGVVEADERWTGTFGPFHVRAAATVHSAPSLGYRLEAGGRSLVYAADGAPGPGLAALAKGADVLLVHTLLPRVDAGSDHARIHATAESAGRLAEEAGVKRLLLSHRFHEEPDAAFLAAATSRFGGKVELVRDGGVLEV